MSVTRNGLLKGTTIYLVANLLNAAIPFALLPVLTRYLSTEQYGEVAVFQTIVGLLAAFVGLNVAGSVSRRFYDAEGGASSIPAAVVSALQIIGISALVVLMLLAVARGPLVDALGLETRWLLAAVLVSASTAVLQLQLSLWQVQQRAVPYGLLQISQGAIAAALSLLLVVVFLWGAAGRIVAQIAAALLAAIVAFLLLQRGHATRLWTWRPDLIGDALRFGVPLIPHVAGIFLLTMADRLVVDRQLGRSDAGIYMVAVQIAAALSLVFDALNKAYVPWLFAQLKEATATGMRRVVRYTYGWFLVILVGVALVLAVAEGLVAWIAGPEFSRSAEVIGWLVVGQGFGGMYLMVTNYIFYSKRTGYLSMATIASGALNLAILPAFVGRWGIEGAGMAFCLSMGIRFLLTWAIAQRVHPMPWFGQR